MTNEAIHPPHWVRKRDGRLVPFEADKISRALFAATESCGRPDAFLSRELADVAVHFLADEAEGSTPTTEQVAESVAKVLRELKQHDLAAAFEQHARGKSEVKAWPESPRRPERDSGLYRFSTRDGLGTVREGCQRAYSLQAVFTRDLAAAHQDGLITLGGLDAPDELAACLLGGSSNGESLSARLEELAQSPARMVVLEGVEHALAEEFPGKGKRASARAAERVAATFLRELTLGLQLTGRRAILNLNSAVPPPWAVETAEGPLFAAAHKDADGEREATLAEALVEAVVGGREVRLLWHLGARDFTLEARDRLLRVARAALAGCPVTFVLDRTRRALSLGEGVERRYPSVLLTVGLHLPRLATLVREEFDDEKDRSNRLLDRVRSLARLALSAALQKREYLRAQVERHPGLARGLVLERARLVVVPVGLDDAVRTVLGRGLTTGGPALELGAAVLGRLREVLRQEGRAATLETCLDALTEEASLELGATAAPGPTCWDAEAPVRNQLRALGALHDAAEGGTGVVFLAGERRAEEMVDALEWAWGHTSAARLRLARAVPSHRQLILPGAEGMG